MSYGFVLFGFYDCWICRNSFAGRAVGLSKYLGENVRMRDKLQSIIGSRRLSSGHIDLLYL
jgi:hypothetical protein